MSWELTIAFGYLDFELIKKVRVAVRAVFRRIIHKTKVIIEQLEPEGPLAFGCGFNRFEIWL